MLMDKGKPPSISLIIPTLNRREMLAVALGSAVQQDVSELELIVVDGGSTDGTAELASSFGATIIDDDRQGLYAALNLGIVAAGNDVVGFLNSDDLLPSGALHAVQDTFLTHQNAKAICGWALLVEDDRTLETYRNERDLRLDAHAALIGTSIINARFFRRQTLQQLPRFDTSFKYVADRLFLANCVRSEIEFIPVLQELYQYTRHDGSLTFAESSAKSPVMVAELQRLSHQVLKTAPTTDDLHRVARSLEVRCKLNNLLRAVRERRWSALVSGTEYADPLRTRDTAPALLAVANRLTGRR